MLCSRETLVFKGSRCTGTPDISSHGSVQQMRASTSQRHPFMAAPPSLLRPVGHQRGTRHAVRVMPRGYTYGVELELCFPSSISRHDIQSALTQANVDGWMVGTDNSITCSRRGCGTPVELRSPILTGNQGLMRIKSACEAIRPLGPKVNKTMGLHVHIGQHERPWVLKHLRNLASNFIFHEPAFDLLVPPSRRGNSNGYCKSLRRGNVIELRSTINSAARWTDLVTAANLGDRKHKLNLLALSKHNTVEFRHPAGSFEGKKITSYVQLYLAFVNASKARCCQNTQAVADRAVSEGQVQTLIRFLKGSNNPQSELFDWMVVRAADLQAATAARAAAPARTQRQLAAVR